MDVNEQALEQVFRLKYGDPGTCGRNPRRRYRFNYYTPDDHYEAMVSQLVTPGCHWLEVGGGRDLFPQNIPLSKELSQRAGRLVGVDPSPNIHENPFVHSGEQKTIEEFTSATPFDLITMRMVAEHITEPEQVCQKLANLLVPGGKLVILTVNKRTPVALAATLIPFWLHHPIKRVIWHTEEKDTFPVVYRMNTRTALQQCTSAVGLKETRFQYLDDCRTFHRYSLLNYAELIAFRTFRAVGMKYPENCLLGVYERPVVAADRITDSVPVTADPLGAKNP